MSFMYVLYPHTFIHDMLLQARYRVDREWETQMYHTDCFRIFIGEQILRGLGSTAAIVHLSIKSRTYDLQVKILGRTGSVGNFGR